MDPRFFTLREVELNNNCPECYSQDGLQLTFKQKFIENSFYKAISKETSHSLFCNICKTMIFPVRWTEDIERVFDYQQRATPPKTESLKLKTLSWILITLVIVSAIIAAVIMVGVFNN